MRSSKLEFLNLYQISQSRICCVALSFYRFLRITQVSSISAFRIYLPTIWLIYLQHFMRNLGKLSSHTMSKTKRELAFPQICREGMVLNSEPRTHPDAWLNGTMPSLQICFDTKSCPGFVAILLACRYWGRFQSLRANQEENLEFCNYPVLTNVLCNSSLW